MDTSGRQVANGTSINYGTGSGPLGIMTGEHQMGLRFADLQPKTVKRNGEIHIGTSGYVFDDWQGAFYPAGLSRRRWLEYYSQHFTDVEINATYYRLLPASTFAGMVQRTPDYFGFWVKVPSAATHSFSDPRPDIKALVEAVEPLVRQGRLNGFLAQFPPSFGYNSTSCDRVSMIDDLTGGIPLAVEFRTTEWENDRAHEFLRERGLILVTVDLPNISGLPSEGFAATGSIAYARFHGRNAETWYNRDAGDRYDYDYSTRERREWMPRIRKRD